MLVTAPLASSIIVAALGALILWSNPSRRVSWAVSFCSLQISAWLGCLHLATAANPGEGLFWVRWACALGGLIPLSFWWVKEAIIEATDRWNTRQRIWIGLGWLVVSSFLVLIPFTDYFVPSHSTPDKRIFGVGYYAYMWTLLGLYTFMFVEAFRNGRKLVGVHRLELQIWLGGGCAMVSSVIVTMALNALTHNRTFIQIQPVLVLVFYGGVAFAITARRIFDARQILIVVAEKTLLVVVISALAYFVDVVLSAFLPAPLDFVVTTAIALWFVAIFGEWLDRIFRFYPQATDARQAAFSAARRGSSVQELREAFAGVVKGWGQSEHALLLHGSKEFLQGNGIELAGDSGLVATFRKLEWVTPERLARERPTPELREIARFLRERHLGVVVVAEGPTQNVLVGAGVPASRRPFTYPQVTQLAELAAIFGSALERAVFAAKAQHAEQLATVGLLGASLAHEIRNPLVSIKTFVQLLPNHYQDQAFRDKFFKLIGDEVTRIDRLTEQLLDLASPRVYTASAVEIHPVVRAGFDLVASKAAGKNIELRQELLAKPDAAWTDPAAVKQVLLNLCFNAIQAVEMQVGERWVLVATRNTPEGVEMAVSDSGPGIATEIRPRLFQPFQSTKSSGFGLGLAICKDILGNLNATITVDAPAPGCGATFRVVFPCQPS
jgi:signal transduction histidine kinase